MASSYNPLRFSVFSATASDRCHAPAPLRPPKRIRPSIPRRKQNNPKLPHSNVLCYVFITGGQKGPSPLGYSYHRRSVVAQFVQFVQFVDWLLRDSNGKSKDSWSFILLIPNRWLLVAGCWSCSHRSLKPLWACMVRGKSD